MASLILVDQDIAEQPLEIGEHVGVFGKKRQAVQQQVAEIGRVQRLQPFLILPVQIDRAAVCELAAVGRRHLIRRQAAILPALDDARQHPRGPSLLVDMLRFEQLPQQPNLVVRIEDREVGFQPDQFRVTAQNADPQRMERAEPKPFGRGADEGRDAVAHLVRRPVGEGHRQNLIGPGTPGVEQLRQAGRQHPRLAGPRACQHQYRTVERIHGLALRLVQGVEPGCRACGLRCGFFVVQRIAGEWICHDLVVTSERPFNIQGGTVLQETNTRQSLGIGSRPW